MVGEKRSAGPFGKKVKYVTICLGLFRGRYVVTALDNGNPHGGWNIILGGPWGQPRAQAAKLTGARRTAKGDETGLSYQVPLFRRDSYLPCVPPPRSISSSRMPYIFGGSGLGARSRPIHHERSTLRRTVVRAVRGHLRLVLCFM